MKSTAFNLQLSRSPSARIWLNRWGREHPAVVLFWSIQGSHINVLFGDPADRQRCYNAALAAKII